jgi:hypothetical protein
MPMKKTLLMLLVSTFSFSCKNTWNEEDKDAFYQACTEEAIKWTGTEEIATTYCDCVFTKMNQRYPSEGEVLEHIAELAQDTGLINCKEQTLKGLGK